MRGLHGIARVDTSNEVIELGAEGAKNVTVIV